MRGSGLDSSGSAGQQGTLVARVNKSSDYINGGGLLVSSFLFPSERCLQS
jgi:hypothetical protein